MLNVLSRGYTAGWSYFKVQVHLHVSIANGIVQLFVARHL